ncbi:MAG: hypothetical protein MT490_03190 [Sphingomonas sp.]|uniref:hypothetical protein n=1 Tax=Sphingomonas sp. TaxID=28214 RepID=UPI0022723BB3|nr:hypothetical protein [Sphingomonas sp.]MCX8474781.1 hypothetical protein [Sphingomonas sp.]
MRAAGRTDRLAAAFWLASLALLLRALLPGGIMPVPAGSGLGAAFVACPGTGPLLADLPGDQDRHGEKAPRSADTSSCVFAGLAVPHLPQAPAPWLPIAFADTDVAAAAVRSEAAPTLMSAPPPPSQGPPRAIA